MKNTDLPSFDRTQRTVFGLLSRTLFGAAYTPEPDVDWTAVYRESECQAVRLQTFCNHHLIPDIPPDLREQISQYLTRAMLHNTRIHARHTEVHRLMMEEGIPYTVLKGAASACYYPSPMTRAMGDVDFYVDRAHLAETVALFERLGFVLSESDHICHRVLRLGDAHLELHFDLPGLPEGDVGQTVRGYMRDLCGETVLLKNGLVTCNRPSDLHHGLIMLMHLQHHLLAEGIGLRHLCDWAVFVHHFRGSEFPDLFEDKLRAVGLWRLARLLSLSASLYIGLPGQDWMRERPEDEETAHALMLDIMAGGNFGRKDRQRAYEGMFISDRGKDGVKKRRLREGFHALNRITYQKWPPCKRSPLLLPIGWAVAITGYLFRNRRRGRNRDSVSALDAYRKSAPRIELYQKLGLYEPES
jgi:hypothetical protein